MESTKYLVPFVCWMLFGAWGYSIAIRNNRDRFLAFIFCFIFGIFGVIGYYIAGQKKEIPKNGN